MESNENTIVAVSTPSGTGGIAVIRMSGPDSVKILSKAWKGKEPEDFQSHTAHLGWITDSDGEYIDQVMATLFRAPNSYTGEDTVEISCHGSQWVQQAIVNRLLECGASPAGAGEFTRRSFMNGRMDLAQAEGVADMIAASSKAAARLASTQMRGDFSRQLKNLRERLLDLGTLLELELDFSEEDVEFADRTQLIELANEILEVVTRMASSYKAGNAFKSGIPVVIAGIPNAGKSTLLNALAGDEKAIVSDIEGTTRDIIEDTVEIDGILFRFFDTAGLRESDDKVEKIGIDKARKKISEAYILLCLLDPTADFSKQNEMINGIPLQPETRRINIVTKSDLFAELPREYETLSSDNTVVVSAHTNSGLDELKSKLSGAATCDFNPHQELVVTNARHYEALKNAEAPLSRLIEGLKTGISADFLAQDLREVEHYLGTITGEVTSTDILHTIFARYCIGK